MWEVAGIVTQVRSRGEILIAIVLGQKVVPTLNSLWERDSNGRSECSTRVRSRRAGGCPASRVALEEELPQHAWVLQRCEVSLSQRMSCLSNVSERNIPKSRRESTTWETNLYRIMLLGPEAKTRRNIHASRAEEEKSSKWVWGEWNTVHWTNSAIAPLIRQDRVFRDRR